LKEFIDKNIKNAKAFNVSITATDLNTSDNVSSIQNITSNYQYAWIANDEKGIKSMN
jgi:hypothetical protein